MNNFLRKKGHKRFYPKIGFLGKVRFKHFQVQSRPKELKMHKLDFFTLIHLSARYGDTIFRIQNSLHSFCIEKKKYSIRIFSFFVKMKNGEVISV